MKLTSIVSGSMLSLTLLTLVSVSQVKAQVVLFTEDFSAGFEKWQPVRDEGQYWQVVDGKAEVLIGRGSTLSEMVPRDEYWHTSWKHVEYEWEFTPVEGADRNLSFAYQDNLNRYDVHFLPTGFELARVRDGQVPFSRNGAYTLVNGQTYLVKLQFNQGRILLTIDGQTIIDVQDVSYDGNAGKISLIGGTGSAYPTRIRYDNLVVRALDDTAQPLPSPLPSTFPSPTPDITPIPEPISLNVPLLKQFDSLWSDSIYDQARRWSDQPTIKRWGCALTSMVMVMQSYGMNVLPNGTLLTPGSLNQWLQNQPDGYVGNGNLNWLAVTRLTKQISHKLQTPVLEYRAHVSPALTTAINEISAQKPVILQLPGHFVVGYGLTDTQTDIQIHDPAFDKTRLSQHPDELISTRTFQPSHTDLSYLLILHSPETKITLTGPEQQILNLTAVSEFIAASDDITQNNGQLMASYLPTPPSGDYELAISQTKTSEYQLHILAYDKKGVPSVFQTQGKVGPQPQSFTIAYRSAKASEIKPKNVLGGFRKDLRNWQKQYHLFPSWQYQFIDQLCALGEKLPAHQQKKIIATITSQIRRLSSSLRPVLKKSLLLQLNALTNQK